MTPRFFLLFRWHVLRHLRRHKLLALLNVFAVALGVAVYIAIQIANHSANRAFSAGVDVVAGKAHLEIRGAIDETLFPLAQKQPDIEAATPLVEGIVTLPDFPGEFLRMLGVDIFTNSPFRTFEIERGSGGKLDIEQWLAKPDGIAISEQFAQRHGIKIGDTLRALVNGEMRALTVTFLMKSEDAEAAGAAQFAAMDIGWAQELFASRGRLSAIQLRLRDPAQAETTVKHLRDIIPPDLTLASPQQRSFQIEKMLGAFELNLTALSMVSLLVGTFLIYNTIFASAARRRVEIGILRSMGATRFEVRALFLGEALVFGAIGIVVGLFGGVALANALVGSVGKTISTLYVLISIQHRSLNAMHFELATLYGIAAVLTGAWIPANEAAKADPVAALTLGARMEKSARIKAWWAFAAFVTLAAALVCAWLALAAAQAWLSFAAAFFVLIGFAMFAPGATILAARIFRKIKSVLLRISAGNLARAAHRSSITIAALASAVAMMIGVSVMIFSFRQSVNLWAGRGLIADLFIAPASNEITGLSAFMPAATMTWLEKMPGVAAVDTYREITAMMNGEPVEIGAVKGVDRRNLRFVGGGEREKMQRLFSSDPCVVVTETFAQKHHVREGDHLPIMTPRGLVAQFEVAGIYYDYTSDRGLIMMDRGLFDQWWRGDARVNSLAVYLKPGTDAQKIAEEFRRQFGAQGEFSIYSNRALRERILAIFDQTFAVTYVLRAIAVIVSIIGIFLSLTALVIERERDIGILRSLGASGAQVRMLFLSEAAMMGAIASALGIAAGIGLSMILTWVVNKAFFGWTIELQFPLTLILSTPLWIVAASVIAAWIPAAQSSRITIARAVRAE